MLKVSGSLIAANVEPVMDDRDDGWTVVHAYVSFIDAILNVD